MDKSELLPCPFCGCEAEIISTKSIHGGYLFGIMCKYCCSRGDFHHTEGQAIDAWNSRAERTCNNVDDHKTVWFICSVCGYQQKLSHTRSYCPNCGCNVVSVSE